MRPAVAVCAVDQAPAGVAEANIAVPTASPPVHAAYEAVPVFMSTGGSEYDIYVGSTLQGTTTSTQYGAGFLLSNTTYTVVAERNGWQSPFTSKITITVVLILVSCSATA